MMSRYYNDAYIEYNTDNFWLKFVKPNLENGVYMLSIADDNGNRAIRKIIVQNYYSQNYNTNHLYENQNKRRDNQYLAFIIL